MKTPLVLVPALGRVGTRSVGDGNVVERKDAECREGSAAVEAETLLTEQIYSIAMTEQEAAQILRVSLRTIDRLIALRELRVRRLGRRVLIPRSSLDSLMVKITRHKSLDWQTSS
jgi:excisionase family DNA binding protein